jgi:hypothetical protein
MSRNVVYQPMPRRSDTGCFHLQESSSLELQATTEKHAEDRDNIPNRQLIPTGQFRAQVFLSACGENSHVAFESTHKQGVEDDTSHRHGST